eukprot:m.61063 g.61063  ORF g.61063 m.61063 type:complete len:498 (-) comp7999_c0_seq1:86-1579(-)
MQRAPNCMASPPSHGQTADNAIASKQSQPRRVVGTALPGDLDGRGSECTTDGTDHDQGGAQSHGHHAEHRPATPHANNKAACAATCGPTITVGSQAPTPLPDPPHELQRAMEQQATAATDTAAPLPTATAGTSHSATRAEAPSDPAHEGGVLRDQIVEVRMKEASMFMARASAMSARARAELVVRIRRIELETWQTRCEAARKRAVVLKNRIKGASPAQRHRYLYALGGVSVDTKRLASCERFDGERWEPIADLPVVRSASAAAVHRGKLYCLGGRQDDDVHASVDMWDGTQWTSVTPMLHTRMACAATSFQGSLFAIGGKVTLGGSRMSSVERLDGGHWTEVAKMRLEVSSMGSATYKDSLYVVGGLDKHARNALRTVCRFDGLRWWSCAPLEQPRIQCAVAVYQGKLWAVGGEGEGNGEFLNTTEKFDGTVWTPGPPMIHRRKACACSVYNGQLYVIGGSDNTGPSHTVERFDGFRWEAVASMSTPRTAAAAATF